jgi:hypothetical protein
MNAKSRQSSKTNNQRRTVPKSAKVRLSDLTPKKEPKGGSPVPTISRYRGLNC